MDEVFWRGRRGIPGWPSYPHLDASNINFLERSAQTVTYPLLSFRSHHGSRIPPSSLVCNATRRFLSYCARYALSFVIPHVSSAPSHICLIKFSVSRFLPPSSSTTRRSDLYRVHNIHSLILHTHAYIHAPLHSTIQILYLSIHIAPALCIHVMCIDHC